MITRATSQNPLVACSRYGDPQNHILCMTNKILLRIVSSIPADNTDTSGEAFDERVKAKKAINRFIALREAYPERSNFFKDEKTIKTFLKEMLHYRKSIGEAPLDNGLHLNLQIVKEVFTSYAKSDNDFLVFFRLKEEVKRVVKEIFDKVSAVFDPANIEMKVIRDPRILFYNDGDSPAKKHFIFTFVNGLRTYLLIQTPFECFRIESDAPQHPPIWALAEFLIAHFKATFLDSFCVYFTNGSFRELPKSDFGQKIRKFGEEKIIQVAESLFNVKKEAKGTQRLIVPEEGWSRYCIKDMGVWDDYVLKMALYVHTHEDMKNFPESWENELKHKEETLAITKVAANLKKMVL